MIDTIHYVLIRDGLSPDDLEAVEVYDDKNKAVEAWKTYESDEFNSYSVHKIKNWFTDDDEWLETVCDPAK